MASKGVVSDGRARTLIGAPDVATYAEIAALAQEVIDERQNSTAHAMNGEVIEEQRLEIVRLRARVDILVKMVAATPVDELVANVKAATAGACKTAHEVEVEAHGAES